MSRELRTGFTTGTCACAAAKAAAILLCEGRRCSSVTVNLPERADAELKVEYVRQGSAWCEAGVRKNSGEDPDITNGVLVQARVAFLPKTDEVLFKAGEGVGIVTLPGLQIPPGEPAINPGPRRMIRDAVRQITSRGLTVEIAVPGGDRLAARTFNPRLGVRGGLSILGTTGIVRPYSHAALRDALLCALDVARGCAVEAPIFVPGNIGRRAAERHFFCREHQVVEVGNEWGFMLDAAAKRHFPALLILGHPGKLAKPAMGYWDTHSRNSPSAVPWLLELARSLDIKVDTASTTAEGVFLSASMPERYRLGSALAERVNEKVGARLNRAVATAVMLIMMNGDDVGRAGNTDRWESRT